MLFRSASCTTGALVLPLPLPMLACCPSCTTGALVLPLPLPIPLKLLVLVAVVSLPVGIDSLAASKNEDSCGKGPCDLSGTE